MNDDDAELVAAIRDGSERAFNVLIGLVVVVIVAVNVQAIDAWIATDPRHPWIVAVAALGALLAIPGMPIAAMPGVRTVGKMLGRWFSG